MSLEQQIAKCWTIYLNHQVLVKKRIFPFIYVLSRSNFEFLSCIHLRPDVYAIEGERHLLRLIRTADIPTIRLSVLKYNGKLGLVWNPVLNIDSRKISNNRIVERRSKPDH